MLGAQAHLSRGRPGRGHVSQAILLQAAPGTRQPHAERGPWDRPAWLPGPRGPAAEAEQQLVQET